MMNTSNNIQKTKQNISKQDAKQAWAELCQAQGQFGLTWLSLVLTHFAVTNITSSCYAGAKADIVDGATVSNSSISYINMSII